MEAAPVEEEFPNSPRSRGSTPTDLLQTLSADLLTQGLQTVKSFGSSTEFSTSEQHTETVSLATELKDKEVKIKEVGHKIYWIFIGTILNACFLSVFAIKQYLPFVTN